VIKLSFGDIVKKIKEKFLKADENEKGFDVDDPDELGRVL